VIWRGRARLSSQVTAAGGVSRVPGILAGSSTNQLLLVALAVLLLAVGAQALWRRRRRGRTGLGARD
jgi:hypothetical protein